MSPTLHYLFSMLSIYLPVIVSYILGIIFVWGAVLSYDLMKLIRLAKNKHHYTCRAADKRKLLLVISGLMFFGMLLLGLYVTNIHTICELTFVLSLWYTVVLVYVTNYTYKQLLLIEPTKINQVHNLLHPL